MEGWCEVYPPPKLPPAEQARLVKAFREAIVELYQKYDPVKVDKVDELMRKYEGGVWHLYKTICAKCKADCAPSAGDSASGQTKSE